MSIEIQNMVRANPSVTVPLLWEIIHNNMVTVLSIDEYGKQRENHWLLFFVIGRNDITSFQTGNLQLYITVLEPESISIFGTIF